MYEGDKAMGYCQVCTTFFWSIKALHAVQVLAWRVLEATKVNLARRWVVVDSIVCCFCGLKEEYLLVIYSLTVELFALFGFNVPRG